MYSSTLWTAILASVSLVLAAPPRARQDTYYGASIAVVVSPGLNPQKVIEPVLIEVNKLTPCDGNNGEGCSVSELIVQNGTASNVDISQIECRGYRDFDGIVPGSAAFNVTKPAMVSTNLATVSSILCYIVPRA